MYEDKLTSKYMWELEQIIGRKLTLEEVSEAITKSQKSYMFTLPNPKELWEDIRDILQENIRILFHGGPFAVVKPEIRKVRYTKDFGVGFYCTEFQDQAKKWCIRKGKFGFVSVYTYTKNTKLNLKKFIENDEWLDFVVDCRRGIPHGHDIVEGPMADDKIFNFVDSFIGGLITREYFWTLMKFNKPTHQISFHTHNALNCLEFMEERGVSRYV